MSANRCVDEKEKKRRAWVELDVGCREEDKSCTVEKL
jgi:hypothetical protein